MIVLNYKFNKNLKSQMAEFEKEHRELVGVVSGGAPGTGGDNNN